MKIVDDTLLRELSLRAQVASRQRANHNLHPQPDDPVQRFLNAIEPGSYVRPHRHTAPPKWELFVILAGAVVVLLFDDEGTVLQCAELRAAGPNRAIEIPPGAWHTLAALEPGTVLFEFKQGPYSPLADKDFAPWAPAEGETACPHFERQFRDAQPGSKPG